jgi:hypothetical protein
MPSDARLHFVSVKGLLHLIQGTAGVRELWPYDCVEQTTPPQTVRVTHGISSADPFRFSCG